MFNAVKRFWKRRVPVTLKRHNGHGMSYKEVIDLVRGLKDREVKAGKYSIVIDAYDLHILLQAHLMNTLDFDVMDQTLLNVRTSEGYVPRMVAMWGEERELGMQEWIEVVPIPGYNYAAIYKYERCVRTGQ